MARPLILLLAITLALTARAELRPGIDSMADGRLEDACVRQSEALRRHVLMVNRLGLTNVRPGILLTVDGHVLAPYQEPVDDTPAPYLVLLPDSTRLASEILFEDAKLNVALLKLSSPPPAHVQPAPLAPADSLKENHLILVPDFGPNPLNGEPASIHLGRRLPGLSKAGTEATFRIDTRAAGHPVFDLAGRLAGAATAFSPDTGAATCTSLQILLRDHPDSAEILPEPVSIDPPALGELEVVNKDDGNEAPDNGNNEDAEVSEENPQPDDPLRDDLQVLAAAAIPDSPCVTIINDGKTQWHAIHGIILNDKGLILTKASELGPSLTCRFRDRDYPAVLLATDESTDLALLSIDAQDLPTVTWSKDRPASGAWLFSPVTLPPSPGSPYEEDAFVTGTFSHPLDENSASHHSVHSVDFVTSTGIIPEQKNADLRVVAILPDSPAEKAGLARGDLLLALDESPIPDRDSLVRLLATRSVGDEAVLRIVRGEKKLDLPLTLGPARLRQPPSGEVPPNLLTIPSSRRSGFPGILVHDLPLESWQCGGPLYDSSGKTIGINIARAAFGRTLALPAGLVEKAIDRMLHRSAPF